ncbi:uncharacterized protein LOC114288720 isoform X4 [Camellia sinensis]|uniref:uncharacterized protein LOC114288720 isoform X4 n=1 Tax=Camellia sinensis TaxID=4442 RepID=UPI0010359CB5|nr:uncharacterized protein LOC114288720 isoform X4 [Camellia sinensis]XP_028088102.1 uncharacterized protein LOC114288720 isoform X4 [Camellia sinensis]
MILSLLFWDVERVSRRMVLAILMPSDYIPGHKITVLEQAFNRNLLGSFLRVKYWQWWKIVRAGSEDLIVFLEIF